MVQGSSRSRGSNWERSMAAERREAEASLADAPVDLALRLLKRLQVGGCELASDVGDIDQLSLLSA
jgi:hypothetical protein